MMFNRAVFILAMSISHPSLRFLIGESLTSSGRHPRQASSTTEASKAASKVGQQCEKGLMKLCYPDSLDQGKSSLLTAQLLLSFL
jgi:hypothetical protein